MPSLALRHPERSGNGPPAQPATLNREHPQSIHPDGGLSTSSHRAGQCLGAPNSGPPAPLPEGASTQSKPAHPLWPSARIHLGQAHGQRGRAPSLNSPIRAPSRTSRPPLHPPKKPPSAFYAGVSERSPDHRSESPRHRHSPRHLQPCRRFPPSTCAAVTSATLPPVAPPPSAGSLR